MAYSEMDNIDAFFMPPSGSLCPNCNKGWDFHCGNLCDGLFDKPTNNDLTKFWPIEDIAKGMQGIPLDKIFKFIFFKRE